MDIESRQEGRQRVVAVAGRLDGTWADHLTHRLETELREGHHDLVLDLQGVQYISSAGVRVLLVVHRQIRQLDGRLRVRQPSDAVRKVLQLTGLTSMIDAPEDSPAVEAPSGSWSASGPASDTASAGPAAPAAVHEHLADGTRFQVHELADAAMRLRLIGRPQALADCAFEAGDSTPLALTADTLAVGVGAFGSGFEDCRELYGDFLAAAGGAVVQPGGIGMRCDHLLAEGAYVPEMQVLYSLVCTGAFSRLLRFEPAQAQQGGPGGHSGASASLPASQAVGLEALIEQALSAVDAPAACVLLVAESAGLIGAGLRRSPAASGAAGTRLTQFPQVRDWLSLAVERLDAGSTVVAVGVVAEPASVPEPVRAFLRPLHRETPWHAHLHAAPLRHRPLPRGRIEPSRVVPPLFNTGSASTVLHLLGDDRDPSQIQESRFVRGACWVAPLDLSQVSP